MTGHGIQRADPARIRSGSLPRLEHIDRGARRFPVAAFVELSLNRLRDFEVAALRSCANYRRGGSVAHGHSPHVGVLAAGFVTSLAAGSATSPQTARSPLARESRVSVEGASLYARKIGGGQPIIVLHGGPDYGDYDFIPREISDHIARAIPNARLVTLKDCGHFAYLECGGDVRKAFDDFFRAESR